jgi:hypothetical protein
MRAAAVLVCLASAAAPAHSVSDEISVGGAQATADVPGTFVVSNLLNAAFDVSDRWTVSGSARVTAENGTNVPALASDWSVGGTVASFSVGADYDVTDNLTMGVSLFGAPRSQVGSVVKLSASRSVLIEATDSDAAFELHADYDTADELPSDVEWFFAGAVAANHYETDQDVGGAVFGSNKLTLEGLRTFCAVRNACSRRLVEALAGNHDALDSVRFSAAALATLFVDTDVGVSGEFYGYLQDPRNAGYLLGVGPIAPLRFLLRPEVTHRFGDLSLRAFAQIGRYAGGTAQSTSGIGARGEYRLSDAFRVWLSASGQSDVDELGGTSRSVVVAAGGGWRF